MPLFFKKYPVGFRPVNNRILKSAEMPEFKTDSSPNEIFLKKEKLIYKNSKVTLRGRINPLAPLQMCVRTYWLCRFAISQCAQKYPVLLQFLC